MSEIKTKTFEGIKMAKTILESIESRDCNKSAKIVIDAAIDCCNELIKLNNDENDNRTQDTRIGSG